MHDLRQSDLLLSPNNAAQCGLVYIPDDNTTLYILSREQGAGTGYAIYPADKSRRSFSCYGKAVEPAGMLPHPAI